MKEKNEKSKRSEAGWAGPGGDTAGPRNSLWKKTTSKSKWEHRAGSGGHPCLVCELSRCLQRSPPASPSCGFTAALCQGNGLHGDVANRTRKLSLVKHKPSLLPCGLSQRLARPAPLLAAAFLQMVGEQPWVQGSPALALVWT